MKLVVSVQSQLGIQRGDAGEEEVDQDGLESGPDRLWLGAQEGHTHFSSGATAKFDHKWAGSDKSEAAPLFAPVSFTASHYSLLIV
ncbi:hypothetical protein NQZ68_011499 [Dissostichus eleginoides]|nr:hypothetical protein NQZ68_011499 [Dissostichus eleginoides]